MKSVLSLLTTAALLALPAAAEIIGVEQFDYADGAIAGQSGGTFWDYKNTSPTGHTAVPSNWDNVIGSPAVSSGRLVTSGNGAVRREYNGNTETNGAVNGVNVARKVFYRVDVTTGPTVTPADYFGISSMDFGTERLYFGKRGGSTTWGVEEVGVGGTNGSVTILPNTTYTLVVHVDFESDFIRLFVNPDLSGPELGDGFAVASRPYTGTNWSTAMRFAAGTAVTWDNLVIATTWKELGTVVTTLADEDNGNLAPASGGGTGVSLREAVKYATSGSLITFAPGLSGQNIILTHPDGDMEIPGTLTIDATALPGGLTVNGNNTSRHFVVGTGRSLTLRGLTLTGGNSYTNPGGAISNDGVLNLFRCTLRGNTGTAGTMSAGGAVFSSGQLRAEDCGFIQNSSPGLGGAIFLLHGGADLIRCTLAGNTAELGGAILVQGATTANLSDCTVSGNHSSGNASGGGCMAIGGTLNLLNCTVSQNTGKGGGGLYLTTPASVHVHSSIIAGNTNPSGGPADIHKPGGTLTNSGANIIGSNESVADSFPASPSPGIPALGSYVGTATSPLDPKLSPLGWFGGPVQTMHPLVGSLAIDTAGPTDPGGTDARGFPRFENGDPASSGSQLDIGAVEAGRISPVNSSAGDNSTGTLRSRIAAITDPGTRITFSPSIAGQTILLGGSQLDIPATPGLFIDASNLTAPVTISGSNASRVFNIPATATVAMHSLKIINGQGPVGAGTIVNKSGGGIRNSGTCTLISSTFSGNSAESIGGAIGNSGTCTVISSTLSGNTAPFGGGGIYNNGTCTVISSTLTGHSVQFGGGIYNEGACNVISSTLSANSAANSGGGIYNNDSIGTFHLSSSIVAGNTAPNGANISNTLTSNINNLTSGDPLLSPLGDYGGPTQTMPPRPGSPAIDAAGPVSEVQQVAISILPTVFTLTFNGATTGSLNQFLTASDVANALQNLSTIGSGNVTVEKTNNEVNETFFRITFIGARGGSNQPQLISNNGSAQITTVRNGSPGSPLATDQRGLRRPRDGDGNGTALPDLGAVEASLALVTTLADAGTGSLRAAVAEVAAQPGADTIFFASALDGGTITLGNAFDITDASPVTIDATALSGGLTLSGGNASRHFTVQNGSTLKLRGLNLTQGNRSGGVGGSILNQGTLDLVRCTFTGNAAVFGGAIHTTGDSLQAQYTTFSGNTANTGGAIYVNTGDLTLTSSTLSGNTAESAAAIFKDGIGAATVTNCTVTGNHGTSGNGAIVAFAGTLDIAFSTISRNVGNGAGGGLFYISPATVSLYASIIAGNTDTSSSVVGPDIYKGDPAAGIFLSDKNFIGTLANSGVAPGPDILVGDPKLSPLGDFGGPVQTMHPLIGSPAIDGSLDETPGDATDARGFPGLVDGDIASPGAQFDLGAVEAGPLFTVTSNAASGNNSLRGKISQGALTTTGARIGFSTAMFPAQTILLDGDEEIFIPATPGLFIDASNLTAPVTISGNNATRVFNIMQGATVAMHSLKMMDGNSSADGGGILNDATLTLMSSTLNSNRSESSGGGLTNFGTCAMHDSTVSGNTTVSGGGGGIRNSGFLSVFSSTFSGNLAPLSEGGGIRNFGTCTIHSSTISGNSAFQGSGIYNADTCKLSSTIVAGNISDNVAGSYTGSSNFIGLDPLLAPLGDYGGPTQTMPPLLGSPAIDAGAATTARTDQRGGSRSRDGDGDFTAVPDIGAVEAGLIPVTTTTDSGPGSLRAALAEATTHPGPDTLFFTTLFIIPSVSTDITLAGEIVINDPAGVTLDASDLPTGVVIDAGPGSNRHFRIASGTPAVFHRLRLYGGNGGGAEATDIGHGGAIRNEGTLTLRECTIADCTSPTFGGAIFNTNPGTLTLERCTLYGNSANAGGGAIQQVSPNLVTLTACTIANNAGGFEAGGINAPFGPASLIHCTVSGNAVTNPGSNGVGGLRGGALTVRDSIVAGNTDANLPGIPNISPGFTAPGTNVTSGDAKLAPFGDYGGPTFTAPPIPGSPAINAATGSTTDFDQRGFARVGTADLGAAEFRGAPDVRTYWDADWDADGAVFGLEHALGTDPLRSDRADPRNLTPPVFDLSGRAQITFGVNTAALPGTQWVVHRSTDLVTFTEIFRYDGFTYTFNNTQFAVIDNGSAVTVIDRFPPSPKAFYRFEALAP